MTWKTSGRLHFWHHDFAFAWARRERRAADVAPASAADGVEGLPAVSVAASSLVATASLAGSMLRSVLTVLCRGASNGSGGSSADKKLGTKCRTAGERERDRAGATGASK